MTTPDEFYVSLEFVDPPSQPLSSYPSYALTVRGVCRRRS